MRQASSPGRLWGVVRDNPGFRRLYAANAVSQLGDWLNVVALLSLLLELTGKGEAVAFVLVIRFLIAFAVGPAAGVLADRVSRRAILVCCDLARAALVLCLLLVRRPEHVPIAYAVMAGHALASALFEPAQTATYPNLVKREDLLLAGTLENSLWSITLAVGSAAGGAVVAIAGRDAAFAADALSFVGSALLIGRLPEQAARAKLDRAAVEEDEERRAPAAQGLSNVLGLRELVEGGRYLVAHAEVRALLAVKAGFGLTLGGVLVLLAQLGEREFGGATGIAALWAARGVGSFAGPFVAFRLGGDSAPALRRGIAGAELTIAGSYALFSLAPSLGAAAAALAVANAGGSILWTYGATMLAQIVPDHVRGRVAAAEMAGFTLALTLSTLAVGKLLDAGVGARPLAACCGLVALLPLAVWLASRPRVRSAA